LTAQNNILKKKMMNLKKLLDKSLITRSKKAIAGFKIREDMELGLSDVTGRKYAF
jgi:ribosomal protein L5